MIYLDYASTTPIDSEVLETYIKIQNNFFANSSSIHKLGQESNYMLEKAKDEIKNLLAVPNHHITFTYNATEANNIAIFGLANKYKSGKIILSKIEHPSINGPCEELKRRGFEVVYIDILPNGQIDLQKLKEQLDKDTIIVSIMWVNNIIGAIQPIGEVIEIMKDFPKAKLIVDAVQGMCKTVPNFHFKDVDIFTFSAHKFYGPKGVGCLVQKNNVVLEPLLYGNNAQKANKPGTIDLALCVACAKALKKFLPLTQENQEYVLELWNFLYENIRDNPKIIINSLANNNSPYIFNLSIPSINSETILRILEQEEIYVSAGSACSSKSKKPEPTVLALSKSAEIASHSIRISLSRLVKKEDLNTLVKLLNSL